MGKNIEIGVHMRARNVNNSTVNRKKGGER